jgi:hypothetical protein
MTWSTTASGGYTGVDGVASGTIPNGGTLAFYSDGTNYHWNQQVALNPANNLSDIGTPATALTNIGGIGAATTNTLTNKTLASTTDVLGGVTMTLGSDATGDMYYRNSSGVMTRLAVCTGTQVIGAAAGIPACVAQSGGSSTITVGTTATSGFTDTHIPYSASSLIQDSGLAIPSSGVLIAAGTTGPTLSAGQLAFGGLLGTPVNPGANDEAQLYLSATNGLILQGRGSSNDIEILAHGGTVGCSGAGAFSWTCNSLIASTTTGAGVSQNEPGNNQELGAYFNNSSATASASAGVSLANANGTEATMILNGSAFSGGNGANALNINAVSNMFLEGNGNNALQIGATGAMTLYNQPTTGTITYGVCAASGANGTGGGALILDTSATVCGLSGMQFKSDIAAFDQGGALRLATLDPETDHSNLAKHNSAVDPFEILKLAPAEYKGDGKTIAYTKPTFGIMAQDACEVDERLCARFPDGTPRTPIPNALMALQVGFDQKLWGVIKEQQKEIDALKARLDNPTIQHAMAQ